MGIKFTCPNGHKLNVKPFLAGKRAVCPKCGVKMRIPMESQIGTAHSEPPHDFHDPEDVRFDPLVIDGPQDSANRYNSVSPAQNGVPDFGMFGPEGEEDDVLWTEDTATGPGSADVGPTADPHLNEAAFLDDPLDDPQANAALADAALIDPAVADAPAGDARRGRGDATPQRAPRPVAPPPLRPPVSRPAAPNSATANADVRGAQPLRPKPILQSMSGPAVDEVIAAASTAPRKPPPPPPQPEDDPIVRFRLQLKRRNRIMMIVSAVLAVIVIVLLAVLVKIMLRGGAPVSPDQPAPASTEPATSSTLAKPLLPLLVDRSTDRAAVH
ncbi:MAG TPA: hypothetical protein VGG30_13015 [Pirellulales bacterium]|jgi:hypothetical protein